MNPDDYVPSDDPNEPIRCDGCGEIFANDAEHIKHLSGGLRPFIERMALTGSASA